MSKSSAFVMPPPCPCLCARRPPPPKGAPASQSAGCTGNPKISGPRDLAASHRRPVNASGFLMADNAVWIEHAAGGFTYTDDETVSALSVRFDTLRSESYRASESAALIERLAGTWAAGGNPLTQTPTAATA